jgi:hypothetical protein
VLLQRAARVVLATVYNNDTVCRPGGDEFVVLAAAGRREGAAQVAGKIGQALAEPCLLAPAMACASRPASASASFRKTANLPVCSCTRPTKPCISPSARRPCSADQTARGSGNRCATRRCRHPRQRSACSARSSAAALS